MDWNLLTKNKWLLILGGLGVLLLVISTLWNNRSAAASGSDSPAFATMPTSTSQTTATNTASSSAGSNAITTIENAYDNKMQAMLSNLQGVHSVSVMATVSSTNALTLANSVRQNTETSTTGKDSRKTTSTDTQPFTESVGGNSVPFVLQTTSPQVTGVLVLVNAQDFYVAKAEIIDAITNVWDVPAYNISVEPEK